MLKRKRKKIQKIIFLLLDTIYIYILKFYNFLFVAKGEEKKNLYKVETNFFFLINLFIFFYSKPLKSKDKPKNLRKKGKYMTTFLKNI